jgi:hypothetical protein
MEILNSYFDACLALASEAVPESERHFVDTPDVCSHKDFQKNFEALRLKGDITNCISPDKKETRHRIRNANGRTLHWQRHPDGDL